MSSNERSYDWPYELDAIQDAFDRVVKAEFWDVIGQWSASNVLKLMNLPPGPLPGQNAPIAMTVTITLCDEGQNTQVDLVGVTSEAGPISEYESLLVF